MTILPVGGVGGFHIGSLQATESGAGGQGTTSTSGKSESGGFAGALGKAINSLEQSQAAATEASQAVATGTASNPESAVVTVQDAQLEMQLASQIRSKATEALQSIFQTQI
ncbi:MAG TPA: flagellar hook-basal body complex protein FliE [Solirubrobacteraceae bacterium]|jgi:flagellar hook-basal body complex protein FliE